MIRDAGFDGAGVRFIDPAYRTRGHRVPARARHDLAGAVLSEECRGPEAGARAGRELGADHLNLQPDVRPYSGSKMRSLYRGLAPAGERGRRAVHIETHRDRMTTDLYFTLHLLDRFPDLRLTADLSHYVRGARIRLAGRRRRTTR